MSYAMRWVGCLSRQARAPRERRRATSACVGPRPRGRGVGSLRGSSEDATVPLHRMWNDRTSVGARGASIGMAVRSGGQPCRDRGRAPRRRREVTSLELMTRGCLSGHRATSWASSTCVRTPTGCGRDATCASERSLVHASGRTAAAALQPCRRWKWGQQPPTGDVVAPPGARSSAGVWGAHQDVSAVRSRETLRLGVCLLTRASVPRGWSRSHLTDGGSKAPRRRGGGALWASAARSVVSGSASHGSDEGCGRNVVRVG